MKEQMHHPQIENPGNILYDLHSLLNELPSKFKDMVSYECSWEDTMYLRKMKAAPGEDNPFSRMSNAEIEMLFIIMDGMIGDLINEYEVFKRVAKSNLSEFKAWVGMENAF